MVRLHRKEVNNLDRVCTIAKENILKGLSKLNDQPITNDNADLYDSLTEALYHLELVEAMKKSDYEYSGAARYYHDGIPNMTSRDGRMGMDGDNDGRYNESRGRMTPRWMYSGHSGKEHMMEDLKAMMADADSERERRAIRDFIEEMNEIKK